MRRHAPGLRLGIAAAAALALAVGTAGAADGPTVSLTLAGTHTKVVRKCVTAEAHADQFSTVGRGVKFNLVGSVRPAPKRAVWKVRVVVKRCTNGHYSNVWTGFAPGRKGGAFRIGYTPRSPGLLIALADFGRHPNVSSRKVRLHVG